jgi:DNA-binding CsgD family transcriptional regulator
MATTSALRTLSEFFADLYRLQEPDGVLRTVDRWARRLAPYDFAVPALTDRPSGAVALPGVPSDFAAGYGRNAAQDAARLAHLRPRHDGAVRLSDLVPSRALERTPIWNEVMRPNGIRHVMTTCLVENPRIAGVLKMVRVDGRDFSEPERDTLALAAPHVRIAYANAEAMTEVAREARRLALVCDRLAGGVLVVARDGRILYENARAAALRRRHVPDARHGPRDGARLPDALRAVVLGTRPQATFGDLVVRAARVGDADEDGDTVLMLAERASAGAPLSPREREVLDWVAEGKTNPEIAAIVGLGVRTVQTHLAHVFEKLGVVSRAQAVAEALRRR